jgi:hypothetical protein
LEERAVYGVMGYRRPSGRQGSIAKREYHYDPEKDVYRCP